MPRSSLAWRSASSDEEWSFFEPFVVSASLPGGRPARDRRRVLDAIFWIARTGAPWVTCRPNWATGTRCSAGSDEGRCDLLEVIDDRYGRTAVVTRQLPVPS